MAVNTHAAHPVCLRVMTIDPSDTEFTTETVDLVEPSRRGEEDGWSVRFAAGFSLFVTSAHEPTPPARGEEAHLYGEGFGFIMRGIVVGGRVYRYRAPLRG